MHIAYVVPSLHVGGMEQFVVQLSAEMRRRGHECTIVCAHDEGPLAAGARESGTRVLVTPFTRAADNLWPHVIVDALRPLRPDVLHTQSGVWLGGSRAAKMLRVPSVHTEHGLDSLNEPFKLRLHKLIAARTSSRIVAVSEPLAETIAQQALIGRNRVEHIDNGIDADAFRRQPDVGAEVRRELGIDSDAVVFASVARLDHLKGIDLLMDALAQVDVGDAKVAVLVIGDGKERADIEHRASRSRVPVRLLGMRSDVRRLLQATDVFVLPSRSEGLPLAVLEAIAAGCCVVASRVGQVPAVLDNGACGVLVDSGDVPALATAISTLARDPKTRRRLSAAGTELVSKRYSIGQMANRYETMYRDLVGATA